MKITNCPICQSNSYNLFLKFDDYNLVECKTCKHIYTLVDNHIDQDQLYLSGNYKEINKQITFFDKIVNFENKRILKKIEKLHTKGLILDFGCGKGKFLNTAQLNGWESFGVETSIPRAEYAIQHYNLSVSTKNYIEGNIFNLSFDIISLFHVLEHIADPKNLVKKLVRDNLKNDGLVIIEVPNIKSIQYKFAGKSWLHLDIPRHINHFSEISIVKLLNETKLEVVKIDYFSSTHGLQGMTSLILNIFGYKGNIISDLKFKRNIKLLILILITLPFAIIFEIVASLFKKGAVIRILAEKMDCKKL